MTQPYDTYQELIQNIRKVADGKTGETIGLSQDEYDMYISYTYPVTTENPNPLIPDVIEFEGNTLQVTPQE